MERRHIPYGGCLADDYGLGCAGREPRVYAEDDVLTMEDVIPGFALPVREALQE